MLYSLVILRPISPVSAAMAMRTAAGASASAGVRVVFGIKK